MMNDVKGKIRNLPLRTGAAAGLRDHAGDKGLCGWEPRQETKCTVFVFDGYDKLNLDRLRDILFHSRIPAFAPVRTVKEAKAKTLEPFRQLVFFHTGLGRAQ